MWKAAEVPRHWTIFSVTASGIFLLSIDGTFVPVVLPELERSFGESTTAISWVLSGFAIAQAALLVTGPGLRRQSRMVRQRGEPLVRQPLGSGLHLAAGQTVDDPAFALARLQKFHHLRPPVPLRGAALLPAGSPRPW